MADDPEISDVLLRTFLTRRELLRDSPAARAIEIVGSSRSADALVLRTYAARQQLPHLWLDADSIAGRALMRVTPLAAADLPAVVIPQRVLRRASPGLLADTLGLSHGRTVGQGRRPNHRRFRARRPRRGGLRRIRGPRDPAA